MRVLFFLKTVSSILFLFFSGGLTTELLLTYTEEELALLKARQS